MDQRPLEKARLAFKNRAPLPVMFNPSEMTRERVANHAKNLPIGYYFSERLSMELFLDSSYWGNEETDIQPFIQELEQASQPNPQRRQSGLCVFHWGSFAFSGTVEEMTVQYLKFLPNGVPTRAKIALVLFQNPYAFETPQENPATHPLKEYRAPGNAGLWTAAWKAYGDPARWREIARENQIMNPRLTMAGQLLKIPLPGEDV
jgi:hypothetical protein